MQRDVDGVRVCDSIVGVVAVGFRPHVLRQRRVERDRGEPSTCPREGVGIPGAPLDDAVDDEVARDHLQYTHE